MSRPASPTLSSATLDQTESHPLMAFDRDPHSHTHLPPSRLPPPLSKATEPNAQTQASVLAPPMIRSRGLPNSPPTSPGNAREAVAVPFLTVPTNAVTAAVASAVGAAASSYPVLLILSNIAPGSVIPRDVWVGLTHQARVGSLACAPVGSKLLASADNLRYMVKSLFYESSFILKDAFRISALGFIYDNSFTLELISRDSISLADTFHVQGTTYYGFFFIHDEPDSASKNANNRRVLRTGPELFSRSSLTQEEATILNSVLKRRKTDIGGLLMSDFENPADPDIFSVIFSKSLSLYVERIRMHLQEGFNWSAERIHKVLSDPCVEKNMSERLQSSLRYAIERWKEKSKSRYPGLSKQPMVTSPTSSNVRGPVTQERESPSFSYVSSGVSLPYQSSTIEGNMFGSTLPPFLLGESLAENESSSEESDGQSQTQKKPAREPESLFNTELKECRKTLAEPRLTELLSKQQSHPFETVQLTENPTEAMTQPQRDALLQEYFRKRKVLESEEDIKSLPAPSRRRLVLEEISILLPTLKSLLESPT